MLHVHVCDVCYMCICVTCGTCYRNRLAMSGSGSITLPSPLKRGDGFDALAAKLVRVMMMMTMMMMTMMMMMMTMQISVLYRCLICFR